MSSPLPYYTAVYLALLVPIYALSNSLGEFLTLVGVYTPVYALVSIFLIKLSTNDTPESTTSTSFQDDWEYQEVEEEIRIEAPLVDVTAHFSSGTSQRYDGVRLTRNETDYQLEKPTRIKPHEHGLRPSSVEWEVHRFIPHSSIDSLEYHDEYEQHIYDRMTFKKAVYVGDDAERRSRR